MNEIPNGIEQRLPEDIAQNDGDCQLRRLRGAASCRISWGSGAEPFPAWSWQSRSSRPSRLACFSFCFSVRSSAGFFDRLACSQGLG